MFYINLYLFIPKWLLYIISFLGIYIYYSLKTRFVYILIKDFNQLLKILIKKMVKKRQFHCQTCGNPCETYRKGRKHKVLICPHCGVIATNPLPLALLAAAPSIIEGVSGIFGKKKKKAGKEEEEGGSKRIFYDSADKPNKGERYVKMALGG